YADALRRRERREPLQHIVGTQAFRDLAVRVGPAAMVPRPETEILVEWALAWLPRTPPLVIDVGTGTGCIACAIAAERGDARLGAGGALLLETAGGEQARAVVALLRTVGFGGVQTRPDLAGVERFVAGRTR